MVMTVSAPWGQGKTTFCEQWDALLRRDGTRTLWFNAWENDHAEDPLLSFVSALRAAAAREAKEAEGPRQEEVRKAGIKLVRTVTNVAADHATGGLLNKTAAEWRRQGEAEEKSDEQLLELALASHEEAAADIRRFQAALTAFAASADGPLVVFVDELDRCRPAFAVGLLEKIKHLFSVEGVVFVLAVDREQLADAASALLGFGKERAIIYLERFIHFDFQLPEPDAGQLVDHLLQRHGITSFNDNSEALLVLREVSRWMGASARQAEAMFHRIKMIVDLGTGHVVGRGIVLCADLVMAETMLELPMSRVLSDEGSWEAAQRVLNVASAHAGERRSRDPLGRFAGRLAALGPEAPLRKWLGDFGDVDITQPLTAQEPKWKTGANPLVEVAQKVDRGYAEATSTLGDFDSIGRARSFLAENANFIGRIQARRAEAD